MWQDRMKREETRNKGKEEQNKKMVMEGKNEMNGKERMKCERRE